MKLSTAAIMAIMCGVLGFAAGYWPQFQQRRAAEASAATATQQAETFRGQLAQATDRVRVSDLLAQFLVIEDVVDVKNFGRAQELSTPWFNAVRAEAQRTPNGDFRKALEAALSFRDQVTAGFTRGDPAVNEQLRAIEDALRAALGFPAVHNAP